MIEVCVVMVIIAVLTAIVLIPARSSRSRADISRARAVAQQLGEAVQQFQRDHNGRLPGPPGGADWGGKWETPVDASNSGAPYLGGTSLEPIRNGTVAVETASGQTTTAGAAARARLRYITDTSTNTFLFALRSDDGRGMLPHCYVTNADNGSAAFAGLARQAGLGKASAC